MVKLDIASEGETYEKWCGGRLHDVGYIAALIQFVGATLFSASTILGVPGVLVPESSTYYAVWDATFWSLQVGTQIHSALTT